MSTSSSASPKKTLESLIYQPGPPPTLQVLDQLLLPHQTVYVNVPDIETTWTVIRTMQIRGTYSNKY
jgi:methylthioribose-1-phosphate isomerase